MPHFYRVFGLTVKSDLDLGDLAPCPADARHQLRVRAGTAAMAEELAGYFALNVPGVGDYYIAGGSDILVVPDAAADPRNVRLYVVGSAMGILLQQRGILALHAAAIDLGSATIALMGRSGAGKSTLSAWLYDQGHGVIADDVCAVGISESETVVLGPGPARIRLWRDAVNASGRNTDDYQASFIGDAAFDKFDIPLTAEAGRTGDRRLSAIYLMEWGDAPSIVQLGGLEAFDAVFANTYRGRFVPAERTEWHWEQCTQLVWQVPIFRYVRPRRQDLMEDLNTAMVESIVREHRSR